MYSRSSRTCSENGRSPRPLTCQMHVIPGWTCRRRRSRSEYRFTSEGTGGRGPTSDMSPATTFQSWGSSSMLLLRMALPIHVIRGSRGILKVRGSPWWFCDCNCCFQQPRVPATIEPEFVKQVRTLCHPCRRAFA